MHRNKRLVPNPVTNSDIHTLLGLSHANNDNDNSYLGSPASSQGFRLKHIRKNILGY